MKYAVYHRKSTRNEGRQRLSIEMQHADIARMMPHWGNLDVSISLDEMRSAKVPGRPLFNQMMKDIERGAVQGIIAWHPDRLSRNAVDAGRIMHLLTTGKLKDLKFVAYTFENTAEGRFMLSIMLSQATYYSDNLSNRVSLAIDTKLGQGWRPNLAPLGYLNDRNTSTIVPDPERFPLVQELWRLMLTANYSVRHLWDMAANEWGLRTRQHAKLGNRPVALSAIYRILTSPFYAGVLTRAERCYPGKHVRMVTIDEFQRVQELLGRPHPSKVDKKEFPFTGHIACAECGFAITAEDKTNPYGSRYTYYHCTKRRLDYRCRQPGIRREALEEQIARFVDQTTLSPAFQSWAGKRIERLGASRQESRQARLATIDRSIAQLDRELKNLVDMRLRELLNDDEYLVRRRDAEGMRLALVQRREAAATSQDWFESARLLISFSSRAAELIRHAEPSRKRLVLKIVGSNPTLSSKIFSCEARKPFRARPETARIPALRATLNEVRTLFESDDPDFDLMLDQIREVLKDDNASPAAA